jgi:hypothetical protein
MRANRWITDLRHFMTAGGDLVSSRPSSLPVYLSKVDEAATARPAGSWVSSPIRCYRRPARKGCRGRIHVYRAESPDLVEWACPVCRASGIITGWEISRWDLQDAWTQPPFRGRKPSHEVDLSDDEYTALRSCTELMRGHRVTVARAILREGRVVLSGSAAEFRQLQNSITVTAAGVRNARRRTQLPDIQSRLSTVLRCLGTT